MMPDRSRYWRRRALERLSNCERYAEARRSVVAFLGGACERCGDAGGYFEIHHVNGNGGNNWSALPSLTRYRLILSGAIPRDQVRLLHAECHAEEDPMVWHTLMIHRRHP